MPLEMPIDQITEARLLEIIENKVYEQKSKERARKLIDLLPDHATWDDIMYEFYVKKRAKALDEAAAGVVVSYQTAKQQIIPPAANDN